MKKRLVDNGQAIPTSGQPAKISQPSNGPLDNPAMAIAPQWAPVWRGRANAIALMRGNQFHTAELKAGPQRVAVVGLIGNQALGSGVPQ